MKANAYVSERGRRGAYARPRVLAGWLRSRAPLSALLAGILALWSGVRFDNAAAGENVNSSLAAALARQGFEVRPEQVIWLDSESGRFRARPVMFIARKRGELEDLYYAEARTGGSGSVLDIRWLTNFSRTSSAVEGPLLKIGRHLAYGVRLGDAYDAVVVLDIEGEPSALTAGWPWYARIQNRITNLQESGRGRGFGRRRYRLEPPARSLRMEEQAGNFIVAADDDRIVIDPEREEPLNKSQRVQPEPMVKARPGMITWLVDTVRNISWIGPTYVEWLEHAVFGVTDRVERVYYGIFGTNTEQEVRQALVIRGPGPGREKAPSTTDPEIGWPPAALKPVLDDQVRGEGEWLPVVDPFFVNSNPHAPPVFYQTFIRVDPERNFTRVYITLWDPRQVQLNIVSGTLEPESATGETGTGMIPRDSDILRRLAAGFNGGFQAMHGEFGMMADGKVYLPPKPWAATVAIFDDGRVGMGSWPGPKKIGWSEEIANSQVPRNMVSFRQNLTSVVEDGTYNPWKRWYWGAAPIWANEQTYIHRSGICLTREKFFAFFWGGSMGPEELGKAMLATRCIRGMELDMNDKHTGFEFYKPYPPGIEPPPLGRKPADYEFLGPTEKAAGFSFGVRLAVTTMTPIRFPRYIMRDPRDFFYLTLKPILPGPDLTVAGKSVRFSTTGLPHAEWPYAFARAEVGEGYPKRLRLVRIDPRRAVPEPVAGQQHGRLLACLSGIERPAADASAPAEAQAGKVTVAEALSRGEAAFFAVKQRIGWKFGVGKPDKSAQVLFWAKKWTEGSTSAAVLGVDKDGFIVYAEIDLDPESSARPALSESLRQAGVQEVLELPQGARLIFNADGRTFAANGERDLRIDGNSGLNLFAEERPAAEVIFPEVQPMPYKYWGWLQNKRVRYFPSGPPRFPTPDSVKK